MIVPSRVAVAFATLPLLALVLSRPAVGEEGGYGHYTPGATATFIDMLPGHPGLVYANLYTFYEGSASPSQLLELGGVVASDVRSTLNADTSLILYETPWELFGGEYAAAIAIPYVWVNVRASAEFTTPGGRRIAPGTTDSTNGVGDIQLLPVMFSWTHGDLKWGANFSVYAPTGSYNEGQLANLGKNFWTFEPGVNISWLSSKIGLELTWFAALDFNTENHTTDYQSGDVFHLDATIAEHLPLFGGFIGLGANGFYYQQITGDSGSGAQLGSFEGHTVGVGPVLSYAIKVWGKDLAAEVKWLPELDVNNRLRGQLVWFKVGLAF